ncbi:leucine-rich repeat domain-containing protein, partial [Mesoaciditoga sp.]
TNLEGIQYCTNLQSLNLSNNDIATITQLASLTNLRSLNLNTNHVDSFQALSGLSNLTSLDVRGNDALDLSPLGGLHKLTALYVGATNSGLPQTNWQFIKNLTNLQQLSMPGLGLTNNDIQFLSGFSQLSWLDLGWNKITDISPLKGLNLQWGLDLSGNNIQNIEALSGMTNLTWLRLNDNPIGNNGLNVIKNLTKLRDLELNGCGITDITPLENLSNLNTLILSNNYLTDISPLMTNGLFASGADLNISNNYLDISDGSTTMNDINTLKGEGVNVTYQPQKGKPQPPYNLRVVSFSSTEITLQWDDNNNDWEYFAVARSTDDTNYTQIATTASLTYEDKGVVSGETYYYKVAAVNPVGYSEWTSSVFATATNQ